MAKSEPPHFSPFGVVVLFFLIFFLKKFLTKIQFSAIITLLTEGKVPKSQHQPLTHYTKMTHTVTADDLFKISKKICNHTFSIDFFEEIVSLMDRFEIDCGSAICIVRTICDSIHCEPTADDLVNYVREKYPDYADEEEYPDFDEIQDQIGYDDVIIFHDFDDDEWCLVDFN